MPKISEAELKKQIKNKDFSPLYVLYGSEKMFVKHYTQKLTEAVVGKNPSDFSFYEFSGQFNLDSFAAAVQSVPFMSEHNCVLVTDIFYDLLKKDESDEIIKICSLASSSVIVIVSMPSYTPEKNSAYFDALVKKAEKIGSVCKFERLNQNTLERYIAKWANENGKTISHINATKLISICGDDLNLLKNEVNKISAYSQDEEISLEDIEKLATATFEANIYAISDAVLKGNSDRAFNLLNLLFYQKTDPQRIFFTLAGSYIDAYRIRVADECGVTQEEVAKAFEYKNRAFVLKKSRTATSRISTQALRKILDVFVDADIKMKSTSVDMRIHLEQLIARLLLIAKERSV